jgi:hypothetical protein
MKNKYLESGAFDHWFQTTKMSLTTIADKDFEANN